MSAAQYHRNRRAAAKSKGICVECNSDPARPNRVKCEGCAAVSTVREAQRWATRHPFPVSSEPPRKSVSETCERSGAGRTVRHGEILNQLIL